MIYGRERRCLNAVQKPTLEDSHDCFSGKQAGPSLVSNTKRPVPASSYPLPLDPSICNIALFHPFTVYNASILLVLLKSYKLLSDDRRYSGERPYIYTAAIILIIYVNINL